MNKRFYAKATLDKDKMVAVASQEIVDREGEILSIDGWQLKNYKDNPVILWGHNATEPPIGNADKIRIGDYNGKKALLFTPKFHDITDKARAIKRMFEEGILKTFSVGFLPLEQDGNKFTKQELLEISAVPVPALPQAQIVARAKDLGIKEEVVKDVLDIKEDKADKVLVNTLKDFDDRLKQIEISLAFNDKKTNELVSKVEGLKAESVKDKGRKNKTDRITQLLKVMDKSVELALREKRK